MELTQEVSELGDSIAVGGGGNYPSFKTRKTTTNLVVQDGHTIIIGGLMKTTRRKSRVGIPLLKDLPVLGYLFGWRSYTNDKTELLMTITPHVIRSKEQADALTQEFSKKVKFLRKELEQRGVLQEEEILKQEGAIQEGDVVKTEE